MNNLIEFLRMFLSYLLAFFTFSAVAALGIFIGIKSRKIRDAKEAALAGTEQTKEAESI